MTGEAGSAILENVLIAEDNALLILNLSDMVTDLGAANVCAVSTVRDALAHLDSERITLAIIDIQLGSENGLVIADRCLSDEIPVILSTGYGDAMRFAVSNKEILLKKPYTMSALARAVTALAERRRE